MIEFFFDVSSPWTYLAFHNIQPMARELGVAIRWRPFLVGGVFNAVNQRVYQQREDANSPKSRYLVKDLADWSRHTGLPIRFPPTVFPVNSVKVMRALCWLERDEAQRPKLEAFAKAAFVAYWERDEDISQDAVLASICAGSGIEPAAMAAAIASQPIKDALKANTDEAIRRGAFGSPTVFVNGDDMFFGNDRLELVRAAVLRAKGAEPQRA